MSAINQSVSAHGVDAGANPAILRVRVIDGQHRIISVVWAKGRRQGQEDVVSLSPLIDTHKFFAPLRKNSELFETVRVIDDGYALAWVNGSIDMSASSVERLAEEAMSGRDFGEFLQRNCLTHQAAAAALGRSKRQIENYLQYATLPRMVVLACIGYETRNRTDNAACIFSSRAEAIEAAKNMVVIGESYFEKGAVCFQYAGWPNDAYGWTLPMRPHAVITHDRNKR